MPDLTNDQLTLVIAAVAAVALIALIVVVVLALRLRRMNRQYKIVRGEGDEVDLVAILSAWGGQIDGYGQKLDSLAVDLKREIGSRRLGIQRFHVVRYDAFEEMGGRLSFSAALLDDHGDGLAITSINGRTESRTYSKPIRNLSSEHNLSEEEREAISKAMAGAGRGPDRKRPAPPPQPADDRSKAG